MKKLTNFFNCAAKAAQKTGGGNSQTQGHQLGVASVITSTLSRFDCVSLASRLRVLDYTRGISALFSSRVYRYVAVLLMVFMVGIGNAWGAASTTTDGATASGTITFDEVGTLSAQNTYWYNGLKFYEQSTNEMSTDNGKRWTSKITPPQYGTFTSGSSWQAGSYEMTGLIMQAHCLAINVSSACTIEIVVNMSGKTLGQSNPVVPGNLKVFWDGTAYNTAYTSSNYKTGTAKTDTTWEQNINGKYNRMKLSIPVSASDLEAKTIDVIKVSYTGSATGTPGYSCAFVYESVKIVTTTAHTVTYKANGGIGSDVVDDGATTIAANTFTAPSGKVFSGWNTQADGEGLAYAVGASVSGDLELYAQWVDGYTVSFDMQEHGSAIAAVDVAAGGKVTAPTAPTADGYVFRGWYKEAGCTNAWDFGTDVVNVATTLYAKWTQIGLPLAAFPSGETLLKNTEWTTTSKNINIYEDNNRIMMYSKGNAISIDGSKGIKVGNSSDPSAFVFYVDAISDIAVTLSDNGKDITTTLYYLGTTTEVLNPSTNFTSGTQCDQKSFTSGDGEKTLSKASGAIGYYKIHSTKTFYAKSISLTAPAAPSCAATVPGNISKGTASGGTGSITLTAAGEIASGDTWYWQSAEDGIATNLGDGATKNVNAVGTYYIRSYNESGNCWSDAKSVEVEAADLLTAISPTLSYDANVIVENTLSPTLEGNAGSGSVTYALNDVTPAGSLTIDENTGVVTAVTVGGTATVTATIAANGNYAAGEATSGTITVLANPLGTHTLTWTMKVGKTTYSSLLDEPSSTSTYMTAGGTLNFGEDVSIDSGNKGESDRTLKVFGVATSSEEHSSGSYVEFPFTITSGYTFTPTAVSVKVANVATAKYYDLVLLNADGSQSVACATYESKKTDGSVETISWSSISGLTLRGSGKLRVYAFNRGENDGFRFGTPITITGTVAEYVPVSCSAYEFHYGTKTQDNWEIECFAQVGETNEWRITNFAVPSSTHYYVGYHGDGEGTSGWNATWSAEKQWTDTYSDGNGAMVLLPGTSAVGQATGAQGSLIIWSDSKDKNKYVGFKPNGYGITYGGNSYAFAATATANVWETDVVTLPDVSTTYTMGLATATEGTYVTCAHSAAAEAISNMSVSNVDGDKKKVYLYTTDEGWLDKNPKMAVYDYTNSRNCWGDGTDATKFMTKVNDNLWYGYVQSDATNLILVRVNPDNDIPAWDWGQSHDITLNAADSYDTYITLSGWSGEPSKANFTKGFAHPATGQKGKFRMWDNSSAQNWYVHFVPYYTLSYDKNGGSGSMAATERSAESASTTVTVAANGFTAPAGKHFAGWAISQENADEGTVDYAAGDDYTLTADATLFAVWKTTYAQSIDLATYAQSHSGTAWQGYLNDNGYSYVLGSEDGAEISLDKNNAFDTGLKLKNSTTSNISFSVAAGKMIKIVTGKVNGLSIAINGGEATAIASGTDATHLATSYYYNAAVQNVVIRETHTSNNIIREIKIENPYTVTYNANGGDPVAAATFYGTTLTLPSASKGTDSFLGWFDAAEGGNKIGDAGASYTPSASIELFAHWEAVSTDARLASITFSSNAGTLEPAFDPEVVNYTYTMPYGTAAVPTITGATAVNANAQDPIIGEAAAAWGSSQTVQGVAQSGDKKTYTVTMVKAPKDGVVIIHADIPSGTSADYAATGLYAGTGNSKNEGSSLKLGTNHYAGVNLSGSEIFKEGDILNIHVKTKNGFVKAPISTTNAVDGSGVIFTEERSFVVGDNFITLTSAFEGAKSSSLYLVRTTAVDAECNPAVDYIEVTRAMNPVLTAISFNSTDVTVTSTSVSATLPNGTNLGSMTVTPTIVWNGAGSAGVTSNAGAWIWGANTYVVTDKDGDATTYTITLNQAATIDRVEISGTLTVMEDLTTALTASVIDTNEEPASIQDVTWSVKSGDEDYAEVSASGVVTGKAVGTAHIIATSVADPTVSAQVEVVVTAFSGCKKAYWFGYADDAATNNVANNSTVFDGAPSSASNNSSKTIKLIEDEWEVSVSKKTGSIGAFGTFTVPAGYNATLYLVTNTGGSRTFQLKQSDVVKYTQNASSGDPVITKFEDVAAGTYTVLSTSNCSGFYMMAAELCRVPMTGVTLDITSKSMLTIDPAFQLTPTFTPANATDKSISWTTTDGDVATVVDGLVTPVGAGTATITVTTTDGGYTATCEVTVSEINCTSFEGTIYEMTAKEQATRKDIAVSAGVENEVALTVADVVYTRGAAASFGVKGSSAKTPRITAKSGETLSAVDYNSGDVYVKIPLGCNLRPTDVITFTANDDTKEFKLGNTAASEGTISTSSLSYTVQSGDALEGRNVLYVWRGGNTGFVSVNVTRVPIVSIESVALSDLTIRTGKTNTPQMTVTPANGTILSAVWEIVSATGVTGSTIDAATGAVTAGTLDDPEQDGTITVKVTLNEDVDLSATCTVTVVDNIAQTNVDGSIVWDWRYTGATSSNQLSNKTDPKKNENFVLANVVTANANFATDKLVVEGEHLTRDYDKATPYFQGQLVNFRFAAATEGVVRITYSHTAGEMTEEKPAREIYINDVATGEIADNATFKASALIPVNASEVTITARNINSTASDDKQYLRIAKIEFYALDKVRDDSWIAPRELGTVCYPNGHIVVGADMYQMAGVNANGKFAFDQVEVTEPGVPYLFEATGYDPIKFYKTTAAAAEEAGTSNGMVGTFVQMTLSPATDVNAYYFQGTHFYAVADRTKDLTVPANRCYVDLTEPHAAAAPRAGVRRITFGVNGTNGATGFENIEASEKPMKLLIDGKIYILRGEKIFDATGRLVK